MFTPGDLPVVLGGYGMGHLRICASFQTDPTDFQSRRVGRMEEEEFEGDGVKSLLGGGAVLAVPPNSVNATASGRETQQFSSCAA